MFGIGLYNAYSPYTIDFLGGTNAALLVALATRLLVAVGWYQLFEKAGKPGWMAFVPIVGPYQAFRLVWDDFSFAALFGMSTFIAFVSALGVDQPIINAFAIFNFIMWWFMALLTARAYGVGMLLGFLYGGVPWLGSILMGFWPNGRYKGPWSSDPEADQNLTAQERKKRRKKAAKEEQRQKELEKKRRKREGA